MDLGEFNFTTPKKPKSEARVVRHVTVEGSDHLLAAASDLMDHLRHSPPLTDLSPTQKVMILKYVVDSLHVDVKREKRETRELEFGSWTPKRSRDDEDDDAKEH
eukprot:PhF_6_TR38290/c0_g1_i2/m.57127